MTRHRWIYLNEARDLRVCDCCEQRELRRDDEWGSMWVADRPGDAAQHAFGFNPLLVGMAWTDNHQGAVLAALGVLLVIALAVLS